MPKGKTADVVLACIRKKQSILFIALFLNLLFLCNDTAGLLMSKFKFNNFTFAVKFNCSGGYGCLSAMIKICTSSPRIVL
jgi:hypothetical protein